MTKTTRRVFFIVSVIAFIAIAGILIAYSRGYQWQWPAGPLVRAGGIFIRANQPLLHVSLNGLTYDTVRRIITDKGTLVNRLVPQTYEAQITKEGYQEWYKQLNVLPGVITEAKFVLLFPKTLPTNRLDDMIGEKLYSLSPSRIAYFILTAHSKRALKIRALDRNENVIVPLPALFASPSAQIDIAAISQSGNTILLVRNDTQRRFALLDTRTGALKNFTPQRSLEAPQFGPNENLYYIDENGLFVLSSRAQTPVLFNAIATPPKAFGIIQNNIVFLEANSSAFLKQANQNGTQNPLVSSQPIQLPSSDAPYRISAINNQFFIFHNQEGVFMIYDNEKNETMILENDIAQFAIDPKGQKIAYIRSSKNIYKLSVFYLAPSIEQPYRDARAVETLAKTTEPIGAIQWLTVDDFTQHLLFEVGGRLTAAELDGRDRRNSALLHGETKSFLLNGLTLLFADAAGQVFQTQLAF